MRVSFHQDAVVKRYPSTWLAIYSLKKRLEYLIMPQWSLTLTTGLIAATRAVVSSFYRNALIMKHQEPNVTAVTPIPVRYASMHFMVVIVLQTTH